MTTTTPAPAEHEHGHPSIVLATLALASVMSVMDLFIVNVALPDIAAWTTRDSAAPDCGIVALRKCADGTRTRTRVRCSRRK